MSDLTVSNPSTLRQEVVFIDTSVSDYQTLVEGLPAGIEVVLIDGVQDGIHQIADWAANNSGYDAIHILSHGSDGQVQLGTASLNNDTLNDYSEALTTIGQSLTEDGDILLYGCNVAASEAGVDFIGKLAQATSADIAASNDLTGAADKSGDWVLEHNSASIEANPLIIKSWNDVLAFENVSFQYDGSTTFVNGFVSDGEFSSTDISDIQLEFAVYTSGAYKTYFYDNIDGAGNDAISNVAGPGPGVEYVNIYTVQNENPVDFDLQKFSVYNTNMDMTFTVYGYRDYQSTFDEGVNADFSQQFTTTLNQWTEVSLTEFTGLQSVFIDSDSGPVTRVSFNDFYIQKTPVLIAPQDSTTFEGIEANEFAHVQVTDSNSVTKENILNTGWDVTMTTISEGTDSVTVQLWDNLNESDKIGVQDYGNSDIQTISIKSNDGSEFTLGSFELSNSSSLNVSIPVLIEGYRDGVKVEGAEKAVNIVYDTNENKALDFTDVAEFGSIDEFVISSTGTAFGHAFIDNIEINPDLIAPSFDSAPLVANASLENNSLDLTVDIDDAGTIYYVVQHKGAGKSWTAEQIKANLGPGNATAVAAGSQAVSDGEFSYTFNIIGLENVAYDIYVVAEDSAGNLTEPQLVDGTLTTDSIFTIENLTGPNYGGPLTETVDGVTLTVSDGTTFFASNAAQGAWVAGDASQDDDGFTTYEFSEAINLISIDLVYTGTGEVTFVDATQGSTLQQTFTLNDVDRQTINLNWSGITAFKVTGGDSGIDNIDNIVFSPYSNNAPTLTATASDPTFTENGDAASLFTASVADAIEAGQTFSELALTVTNVTDTIESLSIDGSTIDLTDANSGTTTTNGLSFSVSIASNTATVNLTGGTLTSAEMQTLVDGIAYSNSDNSPTTSNDRVITITSIKDSGGTDNAGVDTTTLSIASTVSVTASNDAPVLDNTESPAFSSVIEDSAAPTSGSTTNATLVSDLLTGASDPDGDTPLGMAVTAVSSDGTLYYSTDAGANWTALGAVSGTSALILSADADTYVYFKPDANYSGTLTDAMTFKAWDGTGGYTNEQTGVSAGGKSVVGSYDDAGNSTNLDVVNGYAYVTNTVDSLQILDVSDITTPTLVSNIGENDYEMAVDVVGDTAYLITDVAFLIIDVTDKANPSITSDTRLPDSIEDGMDIQVVGNYAYIIEKTNDSLLIFDISNPASPVQKGTVSLDNNTVAYDHPNQLFVDGTTAYIANEYEGLQIVNVSDVNNPTLDHTVSLGAGTSTVRDISVSGNYAYLAEYSGNLKIVDISLETPSLVATLAMGNQVLSVYVDDGVAYVGTTGREIKVVDITDPINPSVIETISGLPSLPFKLSKEGNALYVANSDGGLRIIDLSENTAFSTASDTVSIEVTAINDAPYLNIGTRNIDYAENDSAVTVYASYSSLNSGVGEADTFDGLTLTVSNVSNGSDEVLNIDGTAIGLIDATGTTTTSSFDYSVVVSEGTATITLTNGDLSAADMGSLIKAISYEHLSDNPTEGAREITLTSVTDNGGTENGGVDTKTGTYKSTVTVTAVNDKPVLDVNESPAFSSVLKDSAAPTNGSTTNAVLVSDLLTGATDAESAILGMAVTSVNENGILYFTTDGGITWTELTNNVSETSALVLSGNADTYVYFKPDANYSGTLSDAITFKVWDGTGGYSVGQTVNTMAGEFESSGADNQFSGGLFVETLGNFAYVTDVNMGGAIVGYDITNPENLSFHAYNINGGSGLSIANNLAYVTKGSSLSVVDINNTDEWMYPTLGNVDLGFIGRDLTVVGDVAYVIDQTGAKVTGVTITDPTNMTMNGAIDYPIVGGIPNHAELSDNHLFVASFAGGIQIFDISTSGNPVSSSYTYATTGTAYAIKVVGDYAYVADGAEGLKVLDISDLANITEVGSVDTDGTAIMLKVIDNTVYLADSEAGVQVIDVSDQTNPMITQTILPDMRGEGESTQDVAFANGAIFVADYNNAFLSYMQAENTAFSSDSDTVSLTVNENQAPVIDLGDSIYGFALGTLGNDSTYALATDGDDNLIAVGYYDGTSMDIDPSDAVLNISNVNDDRNAFIAKYDVAGNVLWGHSVGGIGSDTFYDVKTDSAGNIYVSGRFSGITDFNGVELTATSSTTGGDDIDAFIWKLDAQGNTVWAKQFAGETDTERAYSLDVDANGNVYATGTFYGTVDFDPSEGVYEMTPFQDSIDRDVFVVKLDVNGDFVWAKQSGGDDDDYGRSIKVDGNGNVYVGGYLTSDDTVYDDGQSMDLDGDGTAESNFSVVATDGSISDDNQDVGFVSKYSADGTYVWTQTFRSFDIDGSNYGESKVSDIAIDGNGNVYATGQFVYDIDFNPATDVSAQEAMLDDEEHGFLVKLDSNGVYQWHQRFGEDDGTDGEDVDIDKMWVAATGDIYLTGDFNGSFDADPSGNENVLISFGGDDMFALKLDSNGALTWAKQFGATSNDSGDGFAEDSQGNIYLSGDFAISTDIDPTESENIKNSIGGEDLFIARLNSDGERIYETTVTENDGSFSLTLNASDPESDPLTYSLGGTDADVFNIDESTGEITFKNAPNYEMKSSYHLTVSVSDGQLSDTESVVIYVEDSNDLPTGTVTISGTVQQGQTLTVSNTLADEDGLVTVTYQWLRDGQPIADATGETYTLTSVDVGTEISVSASYTDGQGTQESVTSSATSSVNALPPTPTPEPTEAPTEPPTEAPTPEPSVDTVDGVTVETQEETDEESGLQTTTITVAPTTTTRDEDEQTEHSNLADIPIAQDDDGNAVVQISIPTGVGFTAQAVTPAQDENGDLATTLRELLISSTEPRTESEEDLNEIIQEGIDAYVPTVNDEAQVTVRTVTLSTAEGREGPVPNEPIIVTGAMGTGEDDLDNPDRQEALVIDVRDLPSGTVLQLDNVEFAIVIGATSINGGEGRNIVSGDGSSQFIVLGEADDILKGGAGNDTIGSRGGDDELYGGSGDDILFGGSDNDLIDGGVGTDIAVFAYDYAEYNITQLENTEDGMPQWQISHATEGTDTLVNIEYLEFADVMITLTGESHVNDFATSGLLFF